MDLNRPNYLLAAFVTISLLLHLLLIYLTPGLRFLPSAKPAPVIVEMRPKPPTPPSRTRELDLPVRPPLEEPRKRPAKRLGPSDQVVTQETAPVGERPETRKATPPSPRPSPVTPSVPRTAPPNRTESPETAIPGPQPTTKPKIDLAKVMTDTSRAAENIAQRQVEEWRKKYAEEVTKGDAVWLDTEKDLLISFFERFRSYIYGVWNYPAAAAERGEQGTCLLKVVVNRDGTLREVELKESSGSSALDNEALRAVRKAAPYGRLPATYQDETLSIFAFFQYRLGGGFRLSGGY